MPDYFASYVAAGRIAVAGEVRRFTERGCAFADGQDREFPDDWDTLYLHVGVGAGTYF